MNNYTAIYIIQSRGTNLYLTYHEFLQSEVDFFIAFNVMLSPGRNYQGFGLYIFELRQCKEIKKCVLSYFELNSLFFFLRADSFMKV
jgi:hypothetical protein